MSSTSPIVSGLTKGVTSAIGGALKFFGGSPDMFISELGLEIIFEQEAETQISELGVEMVFEQEEETQISELGLEIVFEEV